MRGRKWNSNTIPDVHGSPMSKEYGPGGAFAGNHRNIALEFQSCGIQIIKLLKYNFRTKFIGGHIICLLRQKKKKKKLFGCPPPPTPNF